jgi:hypothetical protein
MLEKRRLEDKKDDYASFSAEFYGNKVILGKKQFTSRSIGNRFSGIAR